MRESAFNLVSDNTPRQKKLAQLQLARSELEALVNHHIGTDAQRALAASTIIVQKSQQVDKLLNDLYLSDPTWRKDR